MGMDVSTRSSRRVLPDSELDQVLPKVEELFSMVGGSGEKRRWYSELENLWKQRLGGEELFRTVLLTESRTSGPVVLWPAEAIRRFPEPQFGARVLGWLEHVAGTQLAVRAIAVAGVFFFANGVRGKRTLPPSGATR